MAGEPGELGEGDDHGGGPRHRPRRPLPEVDLGRLLAVVGADPHEEQDQERDRNHHHPGPLAELAEHEDQGGDAAGGATEAIDGGAPPPARGPRSAASGGTIPAWARVKPVKTPMANSGISESVLPLGGGEQDRGEHRQHPDAPVEDQPVAADGEAVGEALVVGEQAGQHRQASEGGVGGERQHQGDQDGDGGEGPTPAEGVADDLVEDRLVSGPRLDVEALDEDGQAQQHHPQQGPQHQLGPARPGHPGRAEEGHPVGDRLHPGEGAAAGRERLAAPAAPRPSRWCGWRPWAPRGPEVRGERMDQSRPRSPPGWPR